LAKTIRTLNNLKWIYGGTMSRPKLLIGGGVYVLVHHGINERIIYVGTTTSFERRWTEHIEGMRRGNRTVWRLGGREDIYDLMSSQGSKDSYKYYRKMALNHKLWASTAILKTSFSNELNELDDFQKNWFDYTVQSFQPNIHLWACPMNERLEYATILESQIQRVLKINFKIGAHINKNNMSWLGKIEHLEDIFNLKFEFINYPINEANGIEILKVLREKRIIKWNKRGYTPPIRTPRFTKQELKGIRTTYPQAHYQWMAVEHEILKFLIEQKQNVDQISKLLLRTPGEIETKLKLLLVRKQITLDQYSTLEVVDEANT
jgi:hypothetical protein